MERSLTQRFKDKIKRGVHRVSLKRKVKKDKKRRKEHGSVHGSGDEDSPDVLSHNDFLEA